MQLIKPDINIDFMGKSKIALIVSTLLILISVASLVLHKGPNLGIDFAGGSLIQIKFSQEVAIEQIREGLSSIGLGDASVQSFGHGEGEYEYLIRTASAETQAEGFAASFSGAVSKAAGLEPEIRRVEMVGPAIGQELKNKALLAIFYSLLFITIYISARFENKLFLSAITAGAIMSAVYFLSIFEDGIVFLIIGALIISLAVFRFFKFKYAIGAICALLHDVFITVGVFSIFGREFSLPVVAALLTIIGYSLNDTIIIFDRIRENIKKDGKANTPLTKLTNKSINETLSRTLLTSGTTLIAVLALYFLGGEIINNFAFAMLIGICVGTYSSIYVASPIVLAVDRKV